MESRKPIKQENSATNPQNTNQSPTLQSALVSEHQPVPPITTESTSALDSKDQDSPSSPQSNDESPDDEAWVLSPPADYRRSTVLVKTPGIDEKQPLISQSTSSNTQSIELTFFSRSVVSPARIKPVKEVSDVKAIFNLTPEEAHTALSAYWQEIKEQESEKQHRVQSFVAREIREAFLRSYNNLHNQGKESSALAKNMQRAAKPLIDRYAQIKSEWEQTLREINRDLVKSKDIVVEDKPFKWLLHYYEWLSRDGTNDEASKIYKELVGFEAFDGYEEGIAKQTDHQLNAESPTLMMDWPNVLRDASLKMMEEQRAVQVPQSALVTNADGTQLLALVSRPVSVAIPVYYSPDKIEAYFKEKEKREKAASQGNYVRNTLYARFLELKDKNEQAEKDITYHETRITEATEARERHVKTLNQKLRDEGVFDPNLSGNELLMHFQRLYFEERIKVSGSKRQVVYARKGTPETDKRYRKLIAAKRKLDQVEMQLDDYCYSFQTQKEFLTEFSKEGQLDLLTEDRSRPVDEVEEYMIQRGRLERPAKQAIPLPSMLDVLAEHCEKTVCIWSRKHEGQQELQPVHYYVPTQSSGEVIHVLREGDTYRQLHKGKDIVIESASAVERFNVIKAHAYQNSQGQRYYTPISSNLVEEEGLDQQVPQPESYKVDPAYPDDMCRWRDRFFWEAVVAINKAIKKSLGNEGDDALLLLEILLGENSKKAQEGYQDVHQEYLFESIYQETFLKLITMIKTTLIARPVQTNLSVSERRETLDELTRQIKITIESFLPELKHRMEQVMAGFKMDIHYPLSEAAKNTNTAHAIAEQFVERLKHWTLNFLQGDLDHSSAHGIYVMQFQDTGNLSDFIASMQQCITNTEKEVAMLVTAARNCSDLSHDAETSATQVYLAESRDWVIKKTKLLPFYYQSHGQHTRSPERMVQDIQATRIGSLSLAHIALENTGDTLMHFALLAYNKVQGKQKERLFKIIAMLFARDADSNVKNTHNKPQTARQLAKLKLTVPSDLKFVTAELEHQKHHNDFEADVAKKTDAI